MFGAQSANTMVSRDRKVILWFNRMLFDNVQWEFSIPCVMILWSPKLWACLWKGSNCDTHSVRDTIYRNVQLTANWIFIYLYTYEDIYLHALCSFHNGGHIVECVQNLLLLLLSHNMFTAYIKRAQLHMAQRDDGKRKYHTSSGISNIIIIVYILLVWRSLTQIISLPTHHTNLVCTYLNWSCARTKNESSSSSSYAWTHATFMWHMEKFSMQSCFTFQLSCASYVHRYIYAYYSNVMNISCKCCY